MENLQKNFKNATGLTYSLIKKIEAAKDDKEKQQRLFNKLVWLMPGTPINKNKMSEAISETLLAVAKELDIDLDGDINGDGKINDLDKKISSRIEISAEKPEDESEGDGTSEKEEEKDANPETPQTEESPVENSDESPKNE